MKLYLIAPTYEDLHSSAEILTAYGWTMFDLRDVMLHMGIDLRSEQDTPNSPSVAMVRKMTALEMINCHAVVLDDDIPVELAHPTVQFCRYAGLRCVMLSALMEDTRVSMEVLDANNIATIEQAEAKPRPNVRERVQAIVKTVIDFPRRFDNMVGDHMKNPMVREQQRAVYQKNDSLTTTR